MLALVETDGAEAEGIFRALDQLRAGIRETVEQLEAGTSRSA